MAGSLNDGIVVRAIGTGSDESFTMARSAQFVDGHVIATNGGAGTVTIQNGAVAITGALNPASTDTSVTRATTVAEASKSLVTGNTLVFNVSAGTLNYEGYAFLYAPGVNG